MITTCYLIKWENACIVFSEGKQNKIEYEELSNIIIGKNKILKLVKDKGAKRIYERSAVLVTWHWDCG